MHEQVHDSEESLHMVTYYVLEYIKCEVDMALYLGAYCKPARVSFNMYILC